MQSTTTLKESPITFAFTEEQQLIQDFPGIEPWEVTDTTGRSILLDALTAMVNVQATLALAEPLDRWIARRRAPIPGGEEREMGRVSR